MRWRCVIGSSTKKGPCLFQAKEKKNQSLYLRVKRRWLKWNPWSFHSKTEEINEPSIWNHDQEKIKRTNECTTSFQNCFIKSMACLSQKCSFSRMICCTSADKNTEHHKKVQQFNKNMAHKTKVCSSDACWTFQRGSIVLSKSVLC